MYFKGTTVDKLKCKCGDNLSYTVGDTVQSGIYRWYVSSHCCSCGYAVEVDGTGIEDVPPDVQQAIIEKNGEWELLAKSQLSKIKYLMVKLYENNNIDFIAENTLRVYRGTKSQVLWIKKQLIEKGISELAFEIQVLPSK